MAGGRNFLGVAVRALGAGVGLYTGGGTAGSGGDAFGVAMLAGSLVNIVDIVLLHSIAVIPSHPVAIAILSALNIGSLVGITGAIVLGAAEDHLGALRHGHAVDVIGAIICVEGSLSAGPGGVGAVGIPVVYLDIRPQPVVLEVNGDGVDGCGGIRLTAVFAGAVHVAVAGGLGCAVGVAVAALGAGMGGVASLGAGGIGHNRIIAVLAVGHNGSEDRPGNVLTAIPFAIVDGAQVLIIGGHIQIAGLVPFVVPVVLGGAGVHAAQDHLGEASGHQTFVDAVAIRIGHVNPYTAAALDEEVSCKVGAIHVPVIVGLQVNGLLLGNNHFHILVQSGPGVGIVGVLVSAIGGNGLVIGLDAVLVGEDHASGLGGQLVGVQIGFALNQSHLSAGPFAGVLLAALDPGVDVDFFPAEGVLEVDRTGFAFTANGADIVSIEAVTQSRNGFLMGFVAQQAGVGFLAGFRTGGFLAHHVEPCMDGQMEGIVAIVHQGEGQLHAAGYEHLLNRTGVAVVQGGCIGIAVLLRHVPAHIAGALDKDIAIGLKVTTSLPSTNL